jgi:hypothetical protein
MQLICNGSFFWRIIHTKIGLYHIYQELFFINIDLCFEHLSPLSVTPLYIIYLEILSDRSFLFLDVIIKLNQRESSSFTKFCPAY